MIPHALKRRIAAWALRHLEPELGEWRTCRGTHWQLRSINLSLSMHEGSSLEMGYVQPADFIPFISWPDINVVTDETIPDMFIPGTGVYPTEKHWSRRLVWALVPAVAGYCFGVSTSVATGGASPVSLIIGACLLASYAVLAVVAWLH